MKSRKVYSVGDKMHNYGGAQKVMIDVHNGIKQTYDAKILGFVSFDKVNIDYGIIESEYHHFRNPFFIRDSIVVVHARRTVTLLCLLNKLFRLRLRIVYVAHNTYTSKRSVTLLPDTIISISDAVTNNLESYFNVDPTRITKIPNGLVDKCNDKILEKRTIDDGLINILYAARITNVKRQVDIVSNLKGKIDSRIRIKFAGDGPDLDALLKEIGNDNQFEALGFVREIEKLIVETDYLMLFSKNEGLPLSLMEATMFGKPMVINDVGGNLEIGKTGVNAYLANDWPQLIAVLNSLPQRSSKEYLEYSIASRAIYNSSFKYSLMIEKYKNLLNAIHDGK